MEYGLSLFHSRSTKTGPVERVFELHPSQRGSGRDTHQRHAPDYFLCRCRLKSFRCLCLRIFLRRFLITLPTFCSPCSAPIAERCRFRDLPRPCQGITDFAPSTPQYDHKWMYERRPAERRATAINRPMAPAPIVSEKTPLQRDFVRLPEPG